MHKYTIQGNGATVGELAELLQFPGLIRTTLHTNNGSESTRRQRHISRRVSVGERVGMRKGNVGCRGLAFGTDIHQTDKEQKKSLK